MRIYLWGDLYYADKVGVKSTPIEAEGAQTAQAKIRRLADTVRQTAHESAETLWNAALDVLDMDTARCFERALTALVEHGNYSKAMGMVAGLFTLCGVEITMDVVACQKYPAVMRMLDSFEEWYASQFHYKRSMAPHRGRNTAVRFQPMKSVPSSA